MSWRQNAKKCDHGKTSRAKIYAAGRGTRGDVQWSFLLIWLLGALAFSAKVWAPQHFDTASPGLSAWSWAFRMSTSLLRRDMLAIADAVVRLPVRRHVSAT